MLACRKHYRGNLEAQNFWLF